MADESQQTQATEGQRPPAGNPPAPAPTQPTGDPTGPNGGDEKRFSQAELEAIVKDRLERQKRATEAANDKAKADSEAAKLKEQGEWEKAAKAAESRVAELEASLAERDRADLRRKVADRHKLPAALASRLSGDTEEELDADAKELAKLVRVEGEERRPAPGNGPGPKPSGNAPADEAARIADDFMKHRAPVGRL